MRVFCAIVFVLATGSVTIPASAQPAHPVHTYMSGEHAALRDVVALVTEPFRPVYIREVEIPDTVQVGEERAYSVMTNVETATLPFGVRWEFGDGRTANGLHVVHTYEEPGTFEVTVTASNRRSEISRTFDVVVQRKDD